MKKLMSRLLPILAGLVVTFWAYGGGLEAQPMFCSTGVGGPGGCPENIDELCEEHCGSECGGTCSEWEGGITYDCGCN